MKRRVIAAGSQIVQGKAAFAAVPRTDFQRGLAQAVVVRDLRGATALAGR